MRISGSRVTISVRRPAILGADFDTLHALAHAILRTRGERYQRAAGNGLLFAIYTHRLEFVLSCWNGTAYSSYSGPARAEIAIEHNPFHGGGTSGGDTREMLRDGW